MRVSLTIGTQINTAKLFRLTRSNVKRADYVIRVDFEEFGRRIGLATRLVKRELDNFATEQPLAKELINRSFLSDKLKKYYWQSYNYRRTTLQ